MTEVELQIKLQAGGRKYEYVDETLTIRGLKKLLSEILRVPCFQLSFRMARKDYCGYSTYGDDLTLKDLGPYKAIWTSPTGKERESKYFEITRTYNPYGSISQFVLSASIADDWSTLGPIGKKEVVYSYDSTYSELVPKLPTVPTYVTFQIRRLETAYLDLTPSNFKLYRLSKNDSKCINREEIPLRVDERSLVYMINNIANVVCKIDRDLKDGIYEVSFGMDEIKVEVKELIDTEFKNIGTVFQKSGHSNWFILDKSYSEDYNCCICYEEQLLINHLICPNCLTIKCHECVKKMYDHSCKFICQGCRQSMIRY